MYERHTAYRHACKRSAAELARASDYVVLVTPYPKEVAHDTRGWRLVHATEHDLGGVRRTLEVWRNPAPAEPDLPPRVDLPCASPGATRALR